jgi:hypothetical protein
MSSVAAAYSQVPVRAKYLVARATTINFVSASGNPLETVTATTGAYDATPANSFGEVFNVASVATGAAGAMYRDKGKRVTLVNSSKQALAVFALVQEYKNSTGEDPTSGQMYVQVWDAFDPTRITLVSGPA